MDADLEFTAQDLQDGLLILKDTRIVDFSLEDNSGNLVLASKSYDESTGSTTVDLSNWTIEGTWYARLIPVADGINASSGLSINEYLTMLYLARSTGRVSGQAISKGTSGPFLTTQADSIPNLGDTFKASGFEQYIDGIAKQVIIPAYGDYRQYTGIDPIKPGSQGILYHFQVWRSSAVLLEALQDSLDYIDPTGDESNVGNIYYFESNLPFKDDNGTRLSYFWRVRATSKITNPDEDDGNYLWSDWSLSFPFLVNVPPTTPANLEVIS